MNPGDVASEASATAVETGRWILAIAKHLKAFAASLPQLALLYATRRSAQEGELLLRLRGLDVVARRKLEALALDVGIPRQELAAALDRIERTTNLISVVRSSDGREIDRVRETILTEQEVYRAIADLFEDAAPDPAERAIIPLLDLMSRLPLTEEEAIARVCERGFPEERVRAALELQEAFQLLRRQPVADFGITLLYNEYLWGRKIERVGSVLARLGRRETEWLLALMEEVRSNQGESLDRLTAAPDHIVDLAVQTGIVDATTILTASGDEKTFAFSPHFYGYRAGSQPSMIEDTADQVKLFVASIGYGVHHSADFRLHSPLAFVDRLLREGEAGNATPILRDYILLERQGIVSVEEPSPGRGRFVLQKRDVVERALDVMQSGSLLGEGRGPNDVRTLVTQKDFHSPEWNRIVATMGQTAGDTTRFNEELFASIREAAQRGTWS